tara:strand:- start:435 stop:962 length:528 start_codon:yes stop_codon:yes gene_type:complete
MNKKSKIQVHALYLIGFASFMLFLSYASVPLYKLFCQVTGYGGTPIIVEENLASKILDSEIKIRFDSTTEKNSQIYFEPIKNVMNVKIGENNLAFFKAKNRSDEKIKTMSIFNVTPLQAGQYFNKIECFCFEEQVFLPGESVEMPVSFYIDPLIKDNKLTMNLQELTLSYTMFIK